MFSSIIIIHRTVPCEIPLADKGQSSAITNDNVSTIYEDMISYKQNDAYGTMSGRDNTEAAPTYDN